MESGLEKRLWQYREILKKEPMWLEISDRLYEEEEFTAQNITALYVMAPVMCRFVLWVLRQAMEAGKSRLYFLARDGYSMYQTARVLCEKWKLPIECRYLYCSRYALRGAEYYLLREESVSYICLGGIDVTFEKMMRRAGLDDAEMQEVAGAIGFTKECRQPLSYSSVKALETDLKACSVFVDRLVSHAEEKYVTICGYLKQEGLLDEKDYAVVDSGWVGSIQQTLQNLLKSKGFQRVIEGYYFGLYEYPMGVTRENYHAWYFEPDEEIRRKVYFSNSLFECIFSSPEGMATGYTWKNGEYRPILEQKHNPNREKIEQTTLLLQKYATLLSKKEWQSVNETGEFMQETAAKLLYRFMGNPTAQEAENFGNYVFCDDVIGEEKQTVAAHLNQKEIKANRFCHKGMNLLFKKKKPIKESAWLEGSIILNGRSCKAGLRHCAFYKYILYWRKSLKRGN